MMRWAVVLVCAAVAGCAAAPVAESPMRATAVTTGDEAPERVRARIHTELAANYFDLGSMGVALEEVKEALRADAGYGPAYNVAALVYARLKEDRLAEENFRRALSINALDYDANNNYGLFLCQRNREDEGIRHFLEAVRNPFYRSPERSYVNAGLCARQKKDLAQADDYFRRALGRQPGQPQALYHLADLSYLKGDYAEARLFLNRLTQVVPANAQVLWLGVRIEHRLGDIHSAASYAQQLRNNFPESQEAQALAAGKLE
jgi:type IV pilus assembly protein PilF